MRWLIQNYFDPQVKLDRKQSWAAYRRANEFFCLNRRHVRTYLVVTLAPVVILLLWVFVGQEVIVRPNRTIRFLYGPAVLLATYLSHAYVLRHVYAPHVRRAVREFGYDLCLKCGYWLRGLDDDITRCPECGSPRLPS